MTLTIYLNPGDENQDYRRIRMRAKKKKKTKAQHKTPRLTKKLALQICFELWDFMASSGWTNKAKWPGWEKYGYMMSDCPACEFIERRRTSCSSCPARPVWGKGDMVCFEERSPFGRWYNSRNRECRKKYARTIANRVKKLLKELDPVVVEALYYFFRNEYMPVPSSFDSSKFEDIKLQFEYEYLCGSLGDEFEAGYIHVCEDNPEIQKVIGSLSELRDVIWEVTDEESGDYEDKYENFVSNYREEHGFNLSLKISRTGMADHKKQLHNKASNVPA